MLKAVSPPGSAAVDERALIARAANGDRTAARELYDAHVERVHRIAYRISGDADLADDLTQDVFVQVFRRLDQFRGESSFGTWIHRVALTVSLNAMRKVKRFHQRETVLEDTLHFEDEGEGIEPDLRDRLKAAIDALPDGIRAALVMHTIEGYSHAEIGAMLGIAEGTSKARVFDARARLRKALEPHLKERN
ncbi:MAG TPA: RNA polymerase sigma factor [Gemmatimonadaceae bacterium]|nr:RNA polymerase sigma factor [Gemmatimonadaceae bacterium]